MTRVFGHLLLSVFALAAWANQPLYKDIDGNWKVAQPYTLKHAEARHSFKRDGITVSVTYEDVDGATGNGFNHASLGATRRATLEAVLSYICSTLENTGDLDVHVLASLQSGSGALATASPFFAGGVSGFQGGSAFNHITSGVDPFPSLADLQVVVNFGYTINSEMDSPASNEYDLFTILLHEITHGLGMLSGLSADGSTTIQTLYDELLYTGSGKRVFDQDGKSQADAATLVGANHGLVFRGPAVFNLQGEPAVINTPSLFQSGTSLSHWSSGGESSSMQPAIYPGVTQRTYAPFEIAMLTDLGYATHLSFDLIYPWVSNSLDFESTIVVNNPGNREVTLSFTARRADGSSETNSANQLAPNGFFQAKSSDLFPTLGQGAGYTVTLTSSSPRLTGTWVTNDRQANTPSQGLAVTRSVRPSQRAGSNLSLGYLPGNPDFQSAPVLVNTGTSPLDVTVYFFDEQGNHLDSLSFTGIQPLQPKIVTVVGASSGDRYAVASCSEGLITGAVFVFNSLNQTAIGNATTLAVFDPPN